MKLPTFHFELKEDFYNQHASFIYAGIISLCISGALIGTISYSKKKRNSEVEKLTNGIPGDLGLPYLGETLNFGTSPWIFANTRFQKYGSTFKTNVLGHDAIFVSGLDNTDGCELQNLLTDLKSNGPTRFGLIKPFAPLMENTLMGMEGKAHSRNKIVLLRSLSPEILRKNLPRMREIFEERIQAVAGKPVIVYPFARELIYEFMSNLLFQGCSNSLREEIQTLIGVYGKGFLALPLDLGRFSTFGRAIQAKKQLIKIVAKEVERRRNSNSKLQDLLQKIIDEGVDTSGEEIGNMMTLILFGSLDTTASMIESIFLELESNTSVREKLLEEHYRVFKKFQGDEISLDRFDNDLPITDAFILEVFRTRPPFTNNFRFTNQDLRIPRTDFVIPKDYLVIFTQRINYKNDGRMFSEPEKFNLNRFLPEGENAKEKGFSNYLLPFGKGIHGCPGKAVALNEMKMILGICLRRFGNGESWPRLGSNRTFVETPAIYCPKLTITF